MRQIPLLAVQQVVLVDDEDYEVLRVHRWMLSGAGYAYRRGEFRQVLMHREIAEPSDDLVVDHINGNRLDNRRFNLRVCTQLENLRNKHRSGENGLPVQPRTITLHLSAEEVVVMEELEELVGGSSGTSVVRCALRRLAREEGLQWPVKRHRWKGAVREERAG